MRRRHRAPATWLGLMAITLSAGATQAADTYIHCGQVIDGVAEKPRSDVTVIVAGERIESVKDTAELGDVDGDVIDLRNATCLPGLIDAHVHLLIAEDDYQEDHLRRSSAYKALRGLKVAGDMLEAGWTTIRVTGDADVFYAHLDVGTAIREGLFQGPRITGAGHYLSITGGGGDINFIAPEHDIRADGHVVDGVDAVRKAVREEVKHGSDWIKVLASGAMMSAGDDPRRAHYSPGELAALVGEADRLGIPVAAHAHSAAGIKQAVQAGVRSIEHGTFLDEQGIGLMAERGTFLVPTLYITDPARLATPTTDKERRLRNMLTDYRPERFERLMQAKRAGVPIGVGSDFVGSFPVRHDAREFAMLVEAGFTPMEAIQAGTRVNAELLGWSDRVGTIESGKLADIIAVPGNPLEDITLLEKVSFVMLGGEVVRSD